MMSQHDSSSVFFSDLSIITYLASVGSMQINPAVSNETSEGDLAVILAVGSGGREK